MKQINICFLVIGILLFFISCQNDSQQSKDLPANYVEVFKTELDSLDKTSLASLDKATKLFKDFVDMTNEPNQNDSLFMPYFNFYNYGSTLLLDKDNLLIKKYGFHKKNKNGKDFLVPMPSEYLESNIIKYLSNPMQSFCNQQLKEFQDKESLSIIANNTIWWEEFNSQNPNFFLKEMTDYHYKKWHLKNLLMGTNSVEVFNGENKLTEDARNIYLNIIKENPETNTAKILNDYLKLLKLNNMERTDDINQFLLQFK